MVKGHKNEQSRIEKLSRDEVAIKCGQFKAINFPVGTSTHVQAAGLFLLLSGPAVCLCVWGGRDRWGCTDPSDPNEV